MADLPTVVTPEGMQPVPPIDIWRQLLQDVSAIRPGITFNLPGSLMEDISSTNVGAIVLCDSARVELMNSITPHGANAWLLRQLGELFGIDPHEASRTTVGVVFNGRPGFVIRPGVIVSDTVYTYRVVDGGVIGASGQSGLITCIAQDTGVWDVLAGTVTEIETSLAEEATCSNPYPGTPGLLAETETGFRERVMQAFRASGFGMPSLVKTLIAAVPGVVPRLIAMKQTDAGWKVIVGGGDQYAVAWAIFSGMLDIAALVGSTMEILSISNESNGLVTTIKEHGYVNGQTVYIRNALGMPSVNNVPLTVQVVSAKSFRIGIPTTLAGPYGGGGFLEPNNRNSVVSLADYPDAYSVIFVRPPRQTVAVEIQWATSETNYVNAGAVQQLGSVAVAAYINSIYVGQPVNVSQIECVFKNAIKSVLSAELISDLNISVSINGVGVPAVGVLVAGDDEGYLSTPDDGSLIAIEQEL